MLINIIWGALTQSKTKSYVSNNDLELPINSEITTINYSKTNEIYFEVAKRNNYFCSSYARIKPFILSYSRNIISNYAMPNLDKVIYIHTDSLKSIEKLDIKTGLNMGDMVYEGIKEYHKV